MRDNWTHVDADGNHVRELTRVRVWGTGVLHVVFDAEAEPASRPWLMHAMAFDDKYRALAPAPDTDYYVQSSFEHDDGVRWQCRKCRDIKDPGERRHKVRDRSRGLSLGTWCLECAATIST